jgi:hypothetical protein
LFFVVSGAFIIFIFGLGYFIANFLCLKNDNSPFIEKFPFIMTTGFLTNYLILLSVQSLKLSLLLGVIISGCGLVWFFIQQRNELKSIHKNIRVPLVIILSVLALYYFTILSDPLEWWDARSIWFFHAKMIWSAQSINLNAGWHHPSVQFSHVDYPILIPALAAQISYVLGYWNEYTPKLSLFLILIPPVFWIFSFYSRSFSFLFLALIFPFGLKSYLWNGGMDGYVALYAAVSMILIGRYFSNRRPLDLMSSISCLALVSNLKNEGILIGLTGTFAIVITWALSSKSRLIDFKNIFSLHSLCWLSFIISPGILWSVFYKHQWGLINDLHIGTTAAFFRMMNRFSDGVSFSLILKNIFFYDESAVWLALIVFLAAIIFLTIKRRYIVSWIPAMITAITYYVCLIIIYLLTPQELGWHLGTSVQRVMLTVSSCMIAGTFFILKELEDAFIEKKYNSIR